STLLAGAGTAGYGIALDDLNRAYVAGEESNRGSFDTGIPPYPTGPGALTPGTFPLTPDATDAYATLGPRAFLTQFNAAGSGLVFSTFHGGLDSGQGVAVRTVMAGQTIIDREAVMAGYAYSGMPVLNAAQPGHAGGGTDGFVVKWVGML